MVGQSAGAIVSATSAMQLLPIIVIIGAPIVSELTMFFGGGVGFTFPCCAALAWVGSRRSFPPASERLAM